MVYHNLIFKYPKRVGSYIGGFKLVCQNYKRLSVNQPFVRFASTIDASSPEDPFYHSEWPSHKNPSPYEVLNIKKTEYDPKVLRKKYYQFAKIYHPDISSSKVLINHKGDTLTDHHKNERFKLLTNAYHLLRDKQKRDLYDQFRMGWETNEQIMTRRTTYGARTYGRSAAGSYNRDYSNYQYWNAGSWEDYQNMKDMNDPALRDDKRKILAILCAIMIVSATVQGWAILNNAEKYITASQAIHDDTEADLAMSYINYGYDQSRIARLRRFLWFRTFGLYVEKEHLDASHQENEKLLKEIFKDEYEDPVQVHN